ncbi:Diguanylate cyclase with beta propeller sensor [Rubrivivax sp. A210]|uniref:ligand-binding sensor domain-containing diguanylate cyclase n=1 Tax=Rubrivivax sp. A210 TaxID=2772301 RepID=UPI00191B2F7C|nr:ligand-binding sensor domain-containing diguanylate cyclase [Rubrivivax sp. A210]CAD5373253.1 Diguanylate cyclase with beta propeller sensor [Rubrivivax sp. A210]
MVAPLRRGTARGFALVRATLCAAFLAATAPASAASAATAPASLAEPVFESIGRSAIARDVVAGLAQDRAGFLWVGTGDGLMRYDGYQFRPQERQTLDPTRRNLGWVSAMLSARDGRLWIGTETQGLASFDPRTGSVTLYGGQEGKPEATSRILALAEGADGAIWAGHLADGLVRHDPRTGARTHYRQGEQAGSLPGNRVEALLMDRAGTLWVGTWQGLSRLAAGSERFETVLSRPAAEPASRVVQSLLEAPDGRIWVGMQDGELAWVDPHGGNGPTVYPAPAAAGRGGITSMVLAPGGPLWVGHGTGIDLVAPAEGHLLRRLSRDPSNPDGLAANEVTSLLLDSSGSIWVGGIGVGLQRHDPGNRGIVVLGVAAAAGAPLREVDVRGVLPLDNGDIWLAINGGELAVLDPGWKLRLRFEPPLPAIQAMAQHRDGTVWLGTHDALHQFSRERRPLRVLSHDGGNAHRILASGDGSLWVGTQDGLHVLRPGTAALARIVQAGGAVLSGDIYALAEAPDGSLWVGAAGGLYTVDPASNAARPVGEPQGRGLGSPVVIGLLFDRQGVLWVDTAVAGLHRRVGWDGEHASFDRISARHGVTNRPFGSNLLDDGRGRIWTHMYVYDRARDHLHELTPADGARLGNGRFLAYAKTADGHLLFGGTKGLMVVRPEAFDRSAYSPQLVASELRVNGEPRKLGELQDRLQIAPPDRAFSLEFAALDYADPRHIRYAYRLMGYDPEWIATGADLRVASYSNLLPGDYVLQVRATNRSGLWSPNELAIKVQVLPAWWQTKSFGAAVVLTVLLTAGLAVYGAVARHTAVLRRRQEALEAQVRERTATLEAMSDELRTKTAELERSSQTDPLTGMANRRFLAEHIEHDVALSLRRHEDVLLHGAPPHEDADIVFFLVDIDHFKAVNDDYGHPAGDEVLIEMHQRLRLVFRETDYLVRWGGEEFLIVARSTTRACAAELAERVRTTVGNLPFVLSEGVRVQKTCSIGYACFPLSPRHPRALDWSAVVKVADQSLYLVKRGGRDGWLGAEWAEAESPEALQDWAGGPLEAWRTSGWLKMAGSGGGASGWVGLG